MVGIGSRMAAAAVAMAGAAMSFVGFSPAPTITPRRERQYAKARNKPRVAFYGDRITNKHGRPMWGRKLNGVI